METIQQPLLGMNIESLFNLLFETESRDGEVNTYKEKAAFKDQLIAELKRLKEIPENSLSPKDSQSIINLEEDISLIDVAIKANEEVKKEEEDEFGNMLEMRNKLLERKTDFKTSS